MKEHAKTYLRRMLILFVVYSLSVIGINLVDSALNPGPAVRVALSLLPVLPAILILFAIVAFVKTMDEVQRKIISEATIWSAGIIGIATFTYGFLEGAVDLPAVSMIWILAALVAVQGIAMAIIRMSYQ